MGESGAVLGRRPFIKRDILIAAESIYKGERGTRLVNRSSFDLKVVADVNTDRFGNFYAGRIELHGHEDGTVPATFQVIYLVSHRTEQNSLGCRFPAADKLDRAGRYNRSDGSLVTRLPRRSLVGRERPI